MLRMMTMTRMMLMVILNGDADDYISESWMVAVSTELLHWSHEKNPSTATWTKQILMTESKEIQFDTTWSKKKCILTAPFLVQQQCCAMKVERGQLQCCWAEIWFAKNWEIRLSWARQIQLSIIWALCSSVAWRLPPGEEVGMVALFQLHQKCVLGEFQVNCAMHGAFQIPLQWSPEF